MLLTYYVITLWVWSTICLVYIKRKEKRQDLILWNLYFVFRIKWDSCCPTSNSVTFCKEFWGSNQRAIAVLCRDTLVSALSCHTSRKGMWSCTADSQLFATFEPSRHFLPAAAAAPHVTGSALTGSILFPQQGELLLCHVRLSPPASDAELHLCRGTSAGRQWRLSLPCCTNLWAADLVWTRCFYIF